MGETYWAYHTPYTDCDYTRMNQDLWRKTYSTIGAMNSPMFCGYDPTSISAQTWGATSLGVNALSGSCMFPGSYYPQTYYDTGSCPCCPEESQDDNVLNTMQDDETVAPICEQIHESLSPWPIFNENGLVNDMLSKMGDKDPKKLAAVEIAYGQMYGSDDQLRKDLRYSCNPLGFLGLGGGCDEVDTLNEKAAKQSPVNAALGIHEATNEFNFFGLGGDDSTVNNILGSLSSNKIAKTAQTYEYMNGHPMQQDINNLGYFDKKEPTEKLSMALVKTALA